MRTTLVAIFVVLTACTNVDDIDEEDTSDNSVTNFESNKPASEVEILKEIEKRSECLTIPSTLTLKRLMASIDIENMSAGGAARQICKHISDDLRL